ncbi:MAG TPA: ribosomal protein L7/L12 [Rhodothermales bacterium]|nr:ribosomal protein L7/L12 [Rhodothermales bacterium]
MAEASKRIAELIQQGNKIEAIKLLRDTTGIGLKEAKNEVDRLSAELAGQARSSTRPTTASETGQVPNAVLALAQEGRKIEAIKLLREKTGVSLKEAKERVDALTGSTGSGCASTTLVLIVLWMVVLLCF